VLYVVARFVGNVFRNFNPDWSFIPELVTAGLIFRSRIRVLLNFMKFVYLDKKDRVWAWFKPTRTLAIASVAAVALLLPLWHESASGRFVLEAAQHAVLRTAVPGTVVAVYADEGQPVAAGASLVQLRNLPLQSKLAESKAELALATGRATSAALRNVDFAGTTQERDRLTQQTIELESEAAHLSLVSPISGVVVTPRVRDHVGAYAPAGTELVEVADLRNLRVRIYISEHEIYKLQVGSEARLQVDGIASKRDTRVVTIAPLNSQLAPGLEDVGQYQGTRPPNFYVVDLLVPNKDGLLKPGMAGTARLYGRRRSLAGLVAQDVDNFFGRKIW